MKAGEIIASKYQLTARIGQGGMGSVWRATNTATSREFAIKLLHAAVASSEDSRSRFVQEARASARINHPNAIDIFDVGETEDGSLYLVMELLDGISLGEACGSEPPFSARELLIVVSESCTALHAAHMAGIVHRDLKPPNIFLHKDRATGFVSAKVLDFGVSKLTNDDGVSTNTGSLLGSPRYMSPEQAISAASADGRSDIWSIGVLLFESLTGRFPHDGDSSNNLIIAIATTPPKRIDAVAPQLPLSLKMLVDDCLRPVPERIQTVGMLLDRILAILATEDLTQLPLARPTVAKGKMRPRPDGLLVRTTPGMIPGLQTSMLQAHGLAGLAKHLREQGAQGGQGVRAQNQPAAVAAQPYAYRGTVPIAAMQPVGQHPTGQQPMARPPDSRPTDLAAYGQAARPSYPGMAATPQGYPPQQNGFDPSQLPRGGTLRNSTPLLDPRGQYAQPQRAPTPSGYGAANAASTFQTQDPMAESISSINVVGARPAGSIPPNTSRARASSGKTALVALGIVAVVGGGSALAYKELPGGAKPSSTSSEARSVVTSTSTAAPAASAHAPEPIVAPAPMTSSIAVTTLPSATSPDASASPTASATVAAAPRPPPVVVQPIPRYVPPPVQPNPQGDSRNQIKNMKPF